MWQQLAEIGILGLGFDPEESGAIEVLVVMTEAGRRLAPEPVAAAALIPGGIIAEHGSSEQRAQLDEVAEGSRLLAFAHTEPGRRGAAELATRASENAGNWTITGRKNPVLAGDRADVLVVTAALPGGGSGLFLVDAAHVTRAGPSTASAARTSRSTTPRRSHSDPAATPARRSPRPSCASSRRCVPRRSARWTNHCG